MQLLDHLGWCLLTQLLLVEANPPCNEQRLSFVSTDHGWEWGPQSIRP